ncbi:MAG: DCC1-like thiol-disulfide oxidoreductase family protein [Bacteroidota bacterium]
MENKSVIYDGACSLCIRSKNSLISLGFVKKEHVWAYQEMPDAHIPQVDYERFRNEMALIDLDGGPTMYGPEAISYLLSEKLSFLKRVFAIPLFYQIFAFIYRIVSYNRTAIIAPNSKKIRCASCEPDTPDNYRWLWISFALGFSLLFSLILGLFKLSSLTDANFYAGILGAFGLSFWLIKWRKENYLEIAAHVASLFLYGSILLSGGLWLMDNIWGDTYLIYWIPVFLFAFYLIYRDFKSRVDFLQLDIGEQILAALMLGIIFLISYLTLIF